MHKSSKKINNLILWKENCKNDEIKCKKLVKYNTVHNKSEQFFSAHIYFKTCIFPTFCLSRTFLFFFFTCIGSIFDFFFPSFNHFIKICKMCSILFRNYSFSFFLCIFSIFCQSCWIKKTYKSALCYLIFNLICTVI